MNAARLQLQPIFLAAKRRKKRKRKGKSRAVKTLYVLQFFRDSCAFLRPEELNG